MIIDGSRVTKYVYDTEHQKFIGDSWDDAADKFAAWINKNTPYRGICMYGKHKGYHAIYETENGNRYTYNGMTLYRIDEYYNLYSVDQNLISEV